MKAKKLQILLKNDPQTYQLIHLKRYQHLQRNSKLIGMLKLPFLIKLFRAIFLIFYSLKMNLDICNYY